MHSALLDGELTPAERTTVEGHLAGCAECSAELARLARMLGVLHAVPDARASIGFVDRVLAAARPVPWHRRLGRRLLQPWQVKLPLEAAAVVIVALGAVYVFQKTPELQQATRYEAPTPQPAPAPSVSPPATPAPPVASAPAASTPSAPPAPAPDSAPASVPAAPPATPALSARSAEAPARAAEPAQESEASKLESAMKEQDAAGSRDTEVKKRANVMKDVAPPAAAPEKKSAMERREQSGARQDAQPAPADQRLGSAARARAFVPPDVSGRLAVPDRTAAETALADLRRRLGVTEAFRHDAGAGAVSIELIVPRSAYADFTRGLGDIGRWVVEREPSPPPSEAGSTGAPNVRLQILLAP